MNNFPSYLTPKDEKEFEQHRRRRLKAKIREELTEHVLLSDRDSYYSLDSLIVQVRDPELVQLLTAEIIPELEALGWTCTWVYGKTGLFVYSGDPPATCVNVAEETLS